MFSLITICIKQAIKSNDVTKVNHSLDRYIHYTGINPATESVLHVATIVQCLTK